MPPATPALPALLAIALSACAGDAPAGPALRLNHLQALGTHNSYHVLAGAPADPALDYQHAPLDAQLDGGVRHFELDAHRVPDRDDIAVYHIKALDEATTCDTLVGCLMTLRAWSDAHPEHHLIVALIEPKDDLARLAADLGKDPAVSGELLWDGHMADIDRAVDAAWPDRVLTPAHVRGSATTVREAITTRGWPTIDDTRQHLAVVLLYSGTLRDEYLAVPDPRCFLFAQPSDDDAAFIKLDDPIEDAEPIADALAAGFIVRTRADSDAALDPARTAAALASGAQLVSTDYPAARDDGANPGYRLPWPGTPTHPSRCNPITAPPACRDDLIE